MPRLAVLECLAAIMLVVLSARAAAAGPSFVYALQQVIDGNNHVARSSPARG